MTESRIAQWTPGVVFLSVAGWLAVSFSGFKDDVLTQLAQLNTKAQVMAQDIGEIRARSGEFVTLRQMETAIELALLKAKQNK